MATAAFEQNSHWEAWNNMHRYIVYGADSETAQDTNKVFSAPSAKDAEYLANQDGILVSRVEILEGGPAPTASSTVAVDLPKSGQTTNPDIWVIAGWALMFLVPVIGFFIAWYLFDAAVKREPTPFAKISLSIVKILVLMTVVVFALSILAVMFS